MKNRRLFGILSIGIMIVAAKATLVAQERQERRVIRVERDGKGGPEIRLFNPSTVVKTQVFKRNESGGGQKERTWLGVNIGRVSEVTAAQLGLSEGMGLVVEHVVEGSPAEKAGLKRFDILTAIDDQLLVNPDQLQVLVARKGKGESVSLDLLRGGKKRSLNAILEKRTPEVVRVGINGPTGGKPVRSERAIRGWLDDSNSSEGVIDELIWKGKVRDDVGPLHSRTIQIGNAVTILKDDTGSYHLKNENGKKHLRFEDEKGNVVYEGFYNEDSSDSLPEGVLRKLKSIRGPEELGVKHLHRVFEGKHLKKGGEDEASFDVEIELDEPEGLPAEVDVDRSL